MSVFNTILIKEASMHEEHMNVNIVRMKSQSYQQERTCSKADGHAQKKFIEEALMTRGFLASSASR